MYCVILLLLLICNTNAYTFNTETIEGWTLISLHQRCGQGTFIKKADKGYGNNNNRQACAIECEETLGCVHFGYRGGSSKRCNYYTAECNVLSPDQVGSEVIIKSSTKDEMWVRNINNINVEIFSEPFDTTQCKSGSIKENRGVDNRNTPESCAYECLVTYGDECISFSYQNVDGNRNAKRCNLYGRKCTSYSSKNKYEHYNIIGLKLLPDNLPSRVMSRYESNSIDMYVSDNCFIKRIVHSSSKHNKLYSQMSCDNTPLLETDYDYRLSLHDIDTCGNLCINWNNDIINTVECRGFNLKVDGSSFKCILHNCNIYDTNIEITSSDSDENKWGYLDDWHTPICRGQFKDTAELMLDDNFVTNYEKKCTDSKIVKVLKTQSAGECAIRCMGYYNDICSAFEINDDGDCIIYSKCSLEDGDNTISIRNNYKGLTETTDMYVDIFGQSSCRNNDDSEQNERHKDKDYTVKTCSKKCKGNNVCSYFTLTKKNECEIISECGIAGPVNDKNYMTYRFTPNNTDVPTSAPTVASDHVINCYSSEDCDMVSNNMCNNNGHCVIIPCISHDDCFGNFLNGRLPLCNLKTGFCADMYESSCDTLSTCRSIAKNNWKGDNAIAKINLKSMEKDTVKRREMASKVIGEFATVGVNNVYIGVIGNEELTIDNNLIQSVNDTEFLLSSIIENFCGVASSQCGYVTGNGRMLADENVTITLTYNIDDALYTELINTGYSFGSNNFTDALALSLGLDPSDVTIVTNNGDIEIEITIIDDVVDGDPLGEELLDDITAIQSELDNITQNLILELDSNSTEVVFDEADYCGDRTCNSVGLCNNSTGHCACPDSHIGFNCEIKIACNTTNFCGINGICPPDGERCHCQYPYFGPTCNSTITCGVCI